MIHNVNDKDKYGLLIPYIHEVKYLITPYL